MSSPRMRETLTDKGAIGRKRMPAFYPSVPPFME